LEQIVLDIDRAPHTRLPGQTLSLFLGLVQNHPNQLADALAQDMDAAQTILLQK
jgi:hypothetical protein